MYRSFTPSPANVYNLHFHHLKLCLAIVTTNSPNAFEENSFICGRIETRQVILFKFKSTWSCVSLLWPTHLGGEN